MQFLEPAWWGLLVPLALIWGAVLRRWLPWPAVIFFVLLIAALAEPVIWRENTVGGGVVERAEREYAGIRLPGIEVSPRLQEGANFSARVVVESRNIPDDAALEVELFQDGVLVGRRDVVLDGGRQDIVFSDLVAAGPLLLLEARVQLASSGVENAEGKNDGDRDLVVRGAYAVGGALDVVVLGSGEDGSSPRGNDPQSATSAQGVRIRNLSLDELRINPGAVFPADVVILDDVEVGEITGEAWKALRDWVIERGGALLQGGGPGIAGAGDPDEERGAFFPLKFEPPEEDEDSRAVLVVLDRSGSMGQDADGDTKMALANEGALRVTDALRSGDWFGVLAVDVNPLWVVPLGPWENADRDREAIRSITPGGGGIYINTALAESWNQLRNAAPAQRQLLLFADADDVEEKSEGEMTGGARGRPALDLATLMRADQIGISVVALGRETDKDTAWLRELAARGRGRFHRTADARQLPALFTREADEAGLAGRGPLEFFAEPTPAGSRIFPTVDWLAAPPLLDQNNASARSGAEVFLLGRDGTPLLANWRQGRGQVASWASSWQNGWSSEWSRWPDAEKFRGALLNWLATTLNRGDWAVVVQDRHPGRLMVSIRWVADAGAPPAHPPRISLRFLDEEIPAVNWRLAGPGHWQAEVPREDSPLVIEGVAGPGEEIPLTIWNPGEISGGDAVWQLMPSLWQKPIFLRPWILAAAVLWVVVFGLRFQMQSAPLSRSPGH